MVDCQPFQKVRANILCMKPPAQVGLGVKGRNPHLAQQTTDSLAVESRNPVVPKVRRQLAVPPRRIRHMKLVQLPHQRQVCRVLAVRQLLPLLLVAAVHAATISSNQLALTLDANSRFRPGNECGALRGGQRLRQIFF